MVMTCWAANMPSAALTRVRLRGRPSQSIPLRTPLVDLFSQLSDIDGLQRIRFLTSHPNWMTDELLDAVREFPKVMPHIEVPVQAGR